MNLIAQLGHVLTFQTSFQRFGIFHKSCLPKWSATWRYFNSLWWRFMGWNPNDYKAMSSTTESRKQHGSGWLTVSWKCSSFYLFFHCLYASCGHFLHSILMMPNSYWLCAFLVVLLVLRRHFDGHKNKELKNKRKHCLKVEKGERSLRNLWRR